MATRPKPVRKPVRQAGKPARNVVSSKTLTVIIPDPYMNGENMEITGCITAAQLTARPNESPELLVSFETSSTPRITKDDTSIILDMSGIFGFWVAVSPAKALQMLPSESGYGQVIELEFFAKKSLYSEEEAKAFIMQERLSA